MIDPYDFISYPVWLSLSNETRYKIAALFKIEPRGTRQTTFDHSGGHVITDAFIHADLAVITKKSMEEKTGFKSEDFNACFKVLVDFIEGRTEGKLNQRHVQQEEQTKADPRPESAPRRGRPRRQV